MRITIVALMVFSCYNIVAQSLFFLKLDNVNGGQEASIYSFDEEICMSSLIYTLDTVFQPLQGTPYALGARNDSVLYVINTNATIFEININTQTTNIIFIGNENVLFGVSGAVFDSEQNKLFLSRKSLFSYDFGSSQFVDHGFFNSSIVSSISDLVFHKGKLIGSGGGANVSTFFEVNIDDPFSTGIYEEWNNCSNVNLASSFSSCDEPIFYSSIEGDLVTLDEDMNFCEVVCSIGYYSDFASPSEGNGSICSIALDLDDDDSTMADGEYDYTDTLSCQLDSIFPVDSDIELRPAFLEFDSLVVTQLDQFATIDLQTDYAGLLTRVDNGNGFTFYSPGADIASEEFISAVKSIRIIETGIELITPSQVNIGFQVFRDSISSDTAFAFIEILELMHDAGSDLDTSFCSTDSAVDLLSIMDGEDNGVWTPALANPPLYDPLQDDAGVYDYVIAGSLCPSDSSELVVTINDPPSVDLGVDTIICSSSYTLSVNVENNVYYEWSDLSQGNELEVFESGVYYVVGENDCGIDIDSVEIEFLTQEMIFLPSTVVFCEGDSVELDLELDIVNNDILWSNGDMTSSSYLSEEGIYTVSVSNLCLDTTLQVEALVDLAPVGIGSENVVLCPDEEIEIGVVVEVDMEYAWNGGSEESTILVGDGGLYVLSVSNSCGLVQDSFVIEQVEVITNPLQEEYIICDNNAVTIGFSTLYESIVWNTGDTTVSLVVEEPGIYFAIISDLCDSYTFETEIKECINTSIYIPNSFTPNNDGLNDVFYIENPNNVKVNSFSIYDRWGGLVYSWEEGDIADIRWTGSWKGQQVQSGVYAYMLEINENEFRSGTITVVR